MKRFLGVLALLVALSSPAFASPIQISDTLTLTQNFTLAGPRQGGGGPFWTAPTGSSTFDPFATMCVQLFETIGLGGTYKVVGIGEMVDYGGSVADRPLNPFASYLFSTYLPTFKTNTAAQNENIQEVIWFIQGERSSLGGIAARQDLYNEAIASGWTDNRNVRVLQLVDANGNPKQDQLAVYPVPEPGSMSLMGIGLFAVARAARKWKR